MCIYTVRYEWDERKNRRNQEACLESVRFYTQFERIMMAKKLSASSQPGGLKSMRSADIRARKWSEQERQALRRAAKSQAAGDDSTINFGDIPRLTKVQLTAMTKLRNVRRKVPVSLRLDPEVLDWLKSKGQGHLTRINDILLNLMEADRLSR